MSNPNRPWPPKGIPPPPPVPEGWTDADYDEPPLDPPLLRAVRYWALVARFGAICPRRLVWLRSRMWLHRRGRWA